MDQQNLRFISAAITDKGLSKKRPLNEDSYLEIADKGLFAVADGVGGAQAGELASQTAMEVIYEAFAHPRNDVDTEELLEMAIQSANTAIFQMSHELPQLDMMATTIVALRLEGNIATIGHVGDSRIYRLDPRGNLFRETQDHSMVEEEVRAGRMTPAQAANHPSRNVISRALGAEETVEVDLKTIMFEPETTFLLCSDGITRHVNDIEMREILIKHHNPTNACRELKEICYQRGAEDNLTAVVVCVKSAEAGISADFEDETTISTARPAVAEVETQTFATSPMFASRGNTGKLSFPAAAQIPVEVEKPTNALSNAPANNFPQRSAEPVLEPISYTNGIETEETPKKSGGFGLVSTLLGSLLSLLIGIAIGGGLFYTWNQMQKPMVSANPTPANVTKAPNAIFVESLESVDSNPKVAEQYKTDNATELYLRGRAALWKGDYPKAIEELLNARKTLESAPNAEFNKTTLENEIMLALGAAIGQEKDAAKTKEAKGKYDEWITMKAVNSKTDNANKAIEAAPTNSAPSQTP